MKKIKTIRLASDKSWKDGDHGQRYRGGFLDCIFNPRRRGESIQRDLEHGYSAQDLLWKYNGGYGTCSALDTELIEACNCTAWHKYGDEELVKFSIEYEDGTKESGEKPYKELMADMETSGHEGT